MKKEIGKIYNYKTKQGQNIQLMLTNIMVMDSDCYYDECSHCGGNLKRKIYCFTEVREDECGAEYLFGSECVKQVIK